MVDAIRGRFYQTLPVKPREEFRISNIDDIFITYAPCCVPFPGETSVGVVHGESGITIHRSGCRMLSEGDSGNKKVDIVWELPDQIDGVDLKIQVDDQKGVLAKVLLEVKDAGYNISKFNAYSKGHDGFLDFRLEIDDQRKLLKLIARIRKVAGVTAVFRA